jgi:ubiquinone/menaquinone biosynthesis C-methylase UbiE
MNKKQYDKSSEKDKSLYVQKRYNDLTDEKELYATSPDFNLRELEIDFIIENIPRQKDRPKILDVGCGNGYTDIRIAQEMFCDVIGLDFSQKMVEGAKYLRDKYSDSLVGNPWFYLEDCTEPFPWSDNHFDVVISERLVHNLPSREIQKRTLKEIHRVLMKGGVYIMVEGTLDGLKRLNNFRETVGLEPILNRKKSNVMSLKLEDDETEEYLSQYFSIVRRHDFGMYYLISRVIHPLLVSPDEPTFDADINLIARKIASLFPGYKNLGHVRGMVLRKK